MAHVLSLGRRCCTCTSSVTESRFRHTVREIADLPRHGEVVCRDELKQKGFSEWKSPITQWKRRISDATATCLPIFCSSLTFHPQKLVLLYLNPTILAVFLNVFALESVEGGVVGFWECVASLLIKVVTSFSPAQCVAEWTFADFHWSPHIVSANAPQVAALSFNFKKKLSSRCSELSSSCGWAVKKRQHPSCLVASPHLMWLPCSSATALWNHCSSFVAFSREFRAFVGVFCLCLLLDGWWRTDVARETRFCWILMSCFCSNRFSSRKQIAIFCLLRKNVRRPII